MQNLLSLKYTLSNKKYLPPYFPLVLEGSHFPNAAWLYVNSVIDYSSSA